MSVFRRKALCTAVHAIVTKMEDAAADRNEAWQVAFQTPRVTVCLSLDTKRFAIVPR